MNSPPAKKQKNLFFPSKKGCQIRRENCEGEGKIGKREVKEIAFPLIPEYSNIGFNLTSTNYMEFLN